MMKISSEITIQLYNNNDDDKTGNRREDVGCGCSSVHPSSSSGEYLHISEPSAPTPKCFSVPKKIIC